MINAMQTRKKETRKFSSVMAMIMGVLVTLEIMWSDVFEYRLSLRRQDCSCTGFHGIIFRCCSCFDR